MGGAVALGDEGRTVEDLDLDAFQAAPLVIEVTSGAGARHVRARTSNRRLTVASEWSS